MPMGEGGQKPAVAAVAWVAAAALSGGLVLSEVYPLRLLGVGGCLAALWFALPWLARAYPFVRGTARIAGRQVDLEGLGRRLVPPLLVTTLCCGLMWPLLVGQMPRSQDHIVHVTRAWIFLHELLGQGRVTGWSSIWFAGYPAGQLYPPGTDLWVSAFRVLHLGLPDWSVSYAHAFLAFSVLGALALYWLALRATGSRLVGVIAGVLWLLDAGAYREGGWSFTVYWGVWSQVLGLVFAALAISALDRLVDEPSPGRLATAGLLMGGSLLGHPMSAVTLAVVVPLVLIARWLYGAWPRGGLPWCAGAGLLGLSVSAWWLVPMMTRGEWTIRVPEQWRTMDEAAEAVLAGAPFENLWPVIGVLALVGVVRAARERRHLLVGLAMATAALLFVSTTTAFEGLRLEDLSASFGRIIYQRFATQAKVGFFVLAAYGAAHVLLLARAPGSELPWRRRAAVALLAGVLTAPFVLHGVPVISRLHLRGVGALHLATDEPDLPDYREFLEWSRREWDQRDRFYRIAYVQPRNEHFLADAPVYNHTPAYKAGWTPATIFRHRPESDAPEVLQALSVRYVVARRPLRGAHLAEERSFGRIRVYHLRDERPERFHLDGPGRAEALVFEDELIRIRVTGAGEGTRLTAHVATYEDWHAEMDGQDLPIRTVPIFADRYPTFMQVDVPADGVVELRFTRPPLRVGCQILSALALAFSLLLLVAHRVPRLRALAPSLGPAGQILSRITLPVVVAVAVVVAGVSGSRWVRGRDREAPTLAYSLVDHVGRAEAALGREPCPRQGPSKLVCSGPSWAWVGAKQVTVAARERRCIWAHPQARSPLQIEFPEVPLGTLLSGHHGLGDFAATQTPEGTPIRLTVRVEGGVERSFLLRNDVGWVPWQVDTSSLAGERRTVTFVVESESAHRRHYCFAGGVPDEDGEH